MGTTVKCADKVDVHCSLELTTSIGMEQQSTVYESVGKQKRLINEWINRELHGGANLTETNLKIARIKAIRAMTYAFPTLERNSDGDIFSLSAAKEWVESNYQV